MGHNLAQNYKGESKAPFLGMEAKGVHLWLSREGSSSASHSLQGDARGSW